MKVSDFMTFSRSERQQATNKTKKSDTRTHRKKQGRRLEGDDEFSGKVARESVFEQTRVK